LIEYWTNFADIPSATCKCAPYYVFDQSSKTCLPIKNRLPHCVAGAELYGDFVFDLFLQGATDVCVLCEPGYVQEPWQDIARDGALNCIPKIKHCEDSIESVKVDGTFYEIGDIS